MLIGLQASGKSSFYLEKFYRTHIRLNLDMLRTRHREKILFSACLEAKQPVVIDNTNPTRECRRRYIRDFKKYRFEVVGYYFAVGLEECLQRNALREGRERIPEVGLRATYGRLQPPAYAEGFDQLYRVTIENDIFKVEDWRERV
ncbi:AAA family ATPase [Microbulbifer sp.]|uniref:AAA family ATPase n=1 Tax=Microbulbifer sp. TaxID=1908541 RepID=UPI003F674EA8